MECDSVMMVRLMKWRRRRMESMMKAWHITVWTCLFSVLHAYILPLSHWHRGGAGAPFTPLKEPLRIAFTTTASALAGLLSNWTAQRSLKKTSSSVWNTSLRYSWIAMCAFAIFQWRCLQFKCNAHPPEGYAGNKVRFTPKMNKDCACSRAYKWVARVCLSRCFGEEKEKCMKCMKRAHTSSILMAFRLFSARTACRWGIHLRCPPPLKDIILISTQKSNNRTGEGGTVEVRSACFRTALACVECFQEETSGAY